MSLKTVSGQLGGNLDSFFGFSSVGKNLDDSLGFLHNQNALICLYTNAESTGSIWRNSIKTELYHHESLESALDLDPRMSGRKGLQQNTSRG